MDDDEYGYIICGVMCNKLKKDDLSLEFIFVDVLEFYFYKYENFNFMINRVFFFYKVCFFWCIIILSIFYIFIFCIIEYYFILGNYGEMFVVKISEEMSFFFIDY